MHLNIQLPTTIANGATRAELWEKEVITQVGGGEVRNSLWSKPIRTYEIPFPPRQSHDHADVAAVRQIWRLTEGGVHSFNFLDDQDDEIVKVRFDNDLVINSIDGPWVRVETVLLREVR